MSKYSTISDNTIFEARGGRFRKLDGLYYEDLSTGFQTAWDPLFDATIVLSTDVPVPSEDAFITDPQSRLIQKNPNYEFTGETNTEKEFGKMWESGEFDCAANDYKSMAQTSTCAYVAMKELCKLVGVKDDYSLYPVVVSLLADAYLRSQKPAPKTAAKKVVSKAPAKKGKK